MVISVDFDSENMIEKRTKNVSKYDSSFLKPEGFQDDFPD